MFWLTVVSSTLKKNFPQKCLALFVSFKTLSKSRKFIFPEPNYKTIGEIWFLSSYLIRLMNTMSRSTHLYVRVSFNPILPNIFL